VESGKTILLHAPKSLEGLEFFGVKIDVEKSLKSRGKEEVISTPDSKVKVIVVPTDEELMIASDTYEIYEQIAQGINN
jgi:acetate kinase